MQVDDASYHALLAWVIGKAKDASNGDRIHIFGILSKVAPTEAQRALAARVSLSLSQAEAAQLQFGDLFPAPGKGDGK